MSLSAVARGIRPAMLPKWDDYCLPAGASESSGERKDHYCEGSQPGYNLASIVS